MCKVCGKEPGEVLYPLTKTLQEVFGGHQLAMKLMADEVLVTACDQCWLAKLKEMSKDKTDAVAWELAELAVVMKRQLDAAEDQARSDRVSMDDLSTQLSDVQGQVGNLKGELAESGLEIVKMTDKLVADGRRSRQEIENLQGQLYAERRRRH